MAALTKVRPGDPLIIPATTFNAFIDAARDLADRRNSARVDPGRDDRQAGIVLVRNDSGADRARYDILGIGSPIVARGDNDAEFRRQVAITGVEPATSHGGRFVVLAAPAAAGAVVPAHIAGACLVRVYMNSETDGYADTQPHEYTRLASGPTGSARLLWVEPAEDRDLEHVAWCLIRFAGSSGPPGPQPAVITAIYATYFEAKLLDATGDPQGDDLHVHVEGATLSRAYTATPILADCVPLFAVGNQVWIEYRGGWREGWWWNGLALETCPHPT